jgi:ABC-type polysaccharide/polyol phosphate export permease
MFPAAGLHPVLDLLVRWNPMSYAMSALRRALYGAAPPEGVIPSWSGAGQEWIVLSAAAFLTLLLAGWVAARRPLAS